MTPQERIKADAEAAIEILDDQLRPTSNDYGKRLNSLYYYKEGYIAGATAEHERAQQLTDRLGIALENIYNIHSHLWSEFDRKEITSILEQWKSGKGKEVGDEDK